MRFEGIHRSSQRSDVILRDSIYCAKVSIIIVVLSERLALGGEDGAQVGE